MDAEESRLARWDDAQDRGRAAGGGDTRTAEGTKYILGDWITDKESWNGDGKCGEEESREGN